VLTVDVNQNPDNQGDVSMDKQQLIEQSIFKKVAGILLAGILLAGLFTASSAVAQEDGRAIEEIIVTAEKRSESVQEIGLSITALDADGMARLGIVDVSRLGTAVAGLTYATAGNDAKFNLRGSNSTNTFGDNASIVGAYVDGVYKPRASQQTRAFFDIERLEFLKGPQGTLYGRNTFAGALNLHTNKPNTERVAGSVTTSFERYETLRTEGFVNLPVNDTSAVRVAAYYENGSGHLENNAGPNGGAPNSVGVRLSALMAPSDNLDFLFRYTYIQEQGTTAGLFGYKTSCRTTDVNGITDAFGTVTDCQNPERGSAQGPRGDTDPYHISEDFLPDGDLYESVVSLEINWDAGPVAVKSITAYTDYQNEIGFDFEFSPSPHNIGGADEYVESVSQEIVVSSNYDSPFQWTAGGYYSKDETQVAFWVYNHTVRDDSTRPIVTIPEGTFTILDGTFLVSRDTSLNGAFADNHNFDSTTTAVFLQGEFSVSDALRLIAGVRYNEEDKNAFGGGSNFTANGPVTQLYTDGDSPAIVPTTRLEAFAYDPSAPGSNTVAKTYDNTSWKAGIEWDFNDDMMFYLTASNGFLSGALNNNGTSTDEQESQMYEVGIKSVLMDGRLLFNLAYHDTEYTNLLAQLQTLDPNTGIVLTTTRNGGVINAQGIELELQYVPTDEWSLGLTAAFLDAEFGEFFQTSPYQLNRGVATVPESMRGETPGWSPDLAMNFFTEYVFDLANGGTLTPGIFFSYSDAYNTSNLFSLDPNHDQDSYTKTDLRLTWRSPDGNYTVAAYIENLEDEAVASRGNNGSQQSVQTGYLYPQNYGVMFQVNW
jgi:iron complex outermembrane receptor protein